eukprot:TRINITY_DN3745_c0_g1_i1.p1 TRINITY_DN3745_c0_g1~~TRINITY_DN3745_c0_g1_i1.p1  ORF type:complete len:445 (+),score=77.41 TRINITY_DN3745_c0_g1_i1:50-1336(+)
MSETNASEKKEFKKNSAQNKLGDRMKYYESQTTSLILDPLLPFVVRLDGHKFSTFLRAFRKPDDIRVSQAMVATAADLVKKFNPSLAYTCSDEITLVFPIETIENNNTKYKELPFNGRVQKLSTLMASYASVCFYEHILDVLDQEANTDLKTFVKKNKPHFDGRAFNVPGNHELVNNILWRHRFDYRRNSISSLAFKYFNNKTLQGLNGKQMREKLLKEKNINWEDMPGWYKYGVFVKRELYQKEVEQKDGKKIQATRTRTVSHAIELQASYTTEIEKFILSKYFEGIPKEVEVSSTKKEKLRPSYFKINPDEVKVTRVYADEEGNSKFEDIVFPLSKKTEIGNLSEPQPARSITFRYTGPEYNHQHNAPKKQYVLLLDGGVEITISDGTKRAFKTGDILLMEDTKGKGHTSKTIDGNPRKSVFIELE